MDIRKISIGVDLKNAMHYVKDAYVLNGDYIITYIKKNLDATEIWIEGDGEVFLWKSFNNNVPITYEYNINF